MSHIIDYSSILPEFCAQRCTDTSVNGNGDAEKLNPRIHFILNLLKSLKIDYILDSWTARGLYGKEVAHYHNIYLMGTSRNIVMAHHDINNPKSDNCNDNSASVVNAIATRVLNPEQTVTITDCEEYGGRGAQRVSELIKDGFFGEIDFVLNLELSAVGGRNFFSEFNPLSPLRSKIETLFPNTPNVGVPFHDGVILRKNNIDSVVINPCPLRADGKLDLSLLGYCHQLRDNISLANYDDMDIFVREVVTPIITNN